MVPGVLLEPYMSQGDQGVAETPIVSKGLRILTVQIHKCIKYEGSKLNHGDRRGTKRKLNTCTMYNSCLATMTS